MSGGNQARSSNSKCCKRGRGMGAVELNACYSQAIIDIDWCEIAEYQTNRLCLEWLRLAGQSATVQECRHASEVRWTPRILSLCPGCGCLSAVLREDFRFSHGQRLRSARLCDASRRTSGLVAV